MLAAQELRAGTLFQENGRKYIVLEYHHHKMGRGRAVIKVKARDIESGGTREITYNNNGSVEEVDAVRKNMEYIYADQRKGEVILSDPQTKKRTTVPIDFIGKDKLLYLKQGTQFQALVDRELDVILTVELPMTVELKVSETGPSDKGDTAGSARKPATMETGLIIQVPMFMKVGDTIRLNTQTGMYMERVTE